MSVTACLRGGTRVDVAWNLEPSRLPRFDPADGLALTPGGGRLGGMLDGALDGQLVDLAGVQSTRARVVDLPIGPLEGPDLGLEVGSSLRCLLTPADLLPEDLWPLLLQREPVCLDARLEGGEIVEFTLHAGATIDNASEAAIALLRAGESGVISSEDMVTTVWVPRPTLLVLGGGPMAEALGQMARFMGWSAVVTGSAGDASGLAATLSPIDGVVVTGHDPETTGRVLEGALSGSVGYIGSLGPQDVRENRTEWLAYRGVTDVTRVFSPAGLDIGARKPKEVALAVLTEMVASRNSQV